MPSQTQWGIPLIVLPLPSERAGERLFFLTPSSQTQWGIPLFTPLPSERGRGRGCVGCVSGFCQVYVQALEIPLQTARCYCSQINLLSLKIAFVTIENQLVTKRLVKGALLHCKTCPFTHQKMPFYIAKGRLLQRKRA